MDNMKKLWAGSALSSTLNNTFTAVQSQIKHGLDTDGTEARQTATKPPVQNTTAGNSSAAAAGPEKQYLRLPVESARKLRWFDKADLQALVKTHLREKRELMDAMAALKKLLLRAGVTDASIDVEVRHLVGQASDIQEADDGVYNVLLASATAELETLQQSNTELQQQLEEQNKKYAALEAAHATLQEGGPEPLPALDPDVAVRLSGALRLFEGCQASSTLLARQIRAHEQDIVVREAEESMRMLIATAAGGGSSLHDDHAAAEATGEAAVPTAAADTEVSTAGVIMGDALPSLVSGSSVNGEDGGSAAVATDSVVQLQQALARERNQRVSLVAKLQRLEMERRAHVEEVTELAERLRALSAAESRADELRVSLTAAEEKARQLSAMAEQRAAELATACSAAKAAEDLAEKRLHELRKLQQTAAQSDALARYQDLCVEAEERAIAAEKRVGFIDARCAKLDGALKEAQAELKASAKALGASQKELSQLQAKLAAAEAATEAAAALPRADMVSPAHAELLTTAQATLAARDKEVLELTAQVALLKSRLEKEEVRAQFAEAQAAQQAAELHEVEETIAGKEELEAQVAALREHLLEFRNDRAQAEHFKQVCSELEASRTRVDEELLVTARLVTALEARLREALDRALAAEAASAAADGRVRRAEAAVAGQVDSRLAAAATNRALWPPALKEEVGRIEARLEGLQATLVASLTEQERVAALLADEMRLRAEAERHIVEGQEAILGLERQHQARVAELEALLTTTQVALDASSADVQRLEAQLRESQVPGGSSWLTHKPSVGLGSSRHQLRGPLLNSGGSSDMSSSGMHSSGKWQVQNRVGGGSLYGVGDVVLVHNQPVRSDSQCSTSSTSGADRAHDVGPGGSDITGSHPPSPRDLSTPARNPSSDQLSNSQLRGVGSAHGNSIAVRGGSYASPFAGQHAPSRSGSTNSNVDITYLKNVLLKFLEAHATAKIAERDALLPAVAALLQANPAEFKAFKRVLANTNPPTTQLWSALGMR